ncbi:hypothetical protein GH733_008638 [Mirounga leonina]|nr:hypothetical protein GH733_008638 [Mirounga leonina]
MNGVTDQHWAEAGRGCCGHPSSSATTPEDGAPARHLEVIHQHEPFLDLLLGFVAGTEDLGPQNELGQTPRQLAASLWRGPHCRRVHGSSPHWLPQGAPDPYLAQGPKHIPNIDPRTSLEKLEESEEDQKLQLQAENDKDHGPLHVAAILEEADLVWLLQEAQADLNRPEPTGSLHLADLLEGQARTLLTPLCGCTPLGIPGLQPHPIPAYLCTRGAPQPKDEDDSPAPAAAVVTATVRTRA